MPSTLTHVSHLASLLQQAFMVHVQTLPTTSYEPKALGPSPNGLMTGFSSTSQSRRSPISMPREPTCMRVSPKMEEGTTIEADGGTTPVIFPMATSSNAMKTWPFPSKTCPVPHPDQPTTPPSHTTWMTLMERLCPWAPRGKHPKTFHSAQSFATLASNGTLKSAQ